MYFAIAVFAGICLGILLAGAQVPVNRWVPSAAVMILFLLGAVASFRLGAEFTLVGVTFAVAMMLSSWIYQFAIWKREGLLPGVSLRRLVYLSFMNPQYLRALYRERLRAVSGQT